MTLEAEGIVVRRGDRALVDGAELTAVRGEVVALVGPNGAGKSTLLRAIAGTIRTDAGSVRWDGADLRHLPVRARARIVGLVPQAAHLDHAFTVREVVAMGRYGHQGPFGSAGKADQEHIATAIATTHLDALADRSVTTLSGGERQRVLIARVLAQDPALFLLDEPTSNLDLGQAAGVHTLLRRAAADGRAVVVVVHDLEAASRLADRVVLMAAGRILAHGPPQEVLTPYGIATAFGVRASVRWEDDGARIHVDVS